MTRLPDEVGGDGVVKPALILPGVRPAGSSLGGGGLGPAVGSRQSSKLRERLSKNLSVSVVTVPLKASSKNRVFRTFRDGETINTFYDFGEEIYSAGCKSKVLEAKRRSDSAEVVVKIRTKNANKIHEGAWREIMDQVYKIGGHRHVLDLTEIWESPNEFFIVMPKCTGGELFDFLATETEVPESECKRIIRQIFTGIGHLHKNSLIHRDIKPENIMFDIEKGPAQEASPKAVRLIDFDTCVEWGPSTPKSKRFVGTPGYIAPEALLGDACPQSDLWAVGVILHILMTGEMPWASTVSLEDGNVSSPGARKMYHALKNEVVLWDEAPWPDFPMARDLCKKLLAFKLEERTATVDEALAHPWLSEGSKD